jgi:hypothetical protein
VKNVHKAFKGKILAFLGENIPILGKGKQPLFGCKIKGKKSLTETWNLHIVGSIPRLTN